MSGSTEPPPNSIVAHDLTLPIDEAQDALAAIRHGEVDALVVTDDDGQPRVYTLKGADHAHRILLETLNEGAITIGPDTAILYANRRFAEMLGAPLDKVLGATLEGFVASWDRGGFAALLAKAKEGHAKGEITLETASGTALPALISMRAIGDGDPYTVVVTDLTSLKEAQLALARANDELEARVEARTEALRAEIVARERLEDELLQKASALVEADRRKDEFLSMLAHELRNPLAPIVAAVEMMRLKIRGDAALDRYRAIIDRQAKNLARIVDDLLDVSRITRSSITLRKETVQLAAIVKSAVEAARPLITDGGHELVVSLPPEPVELHADPTRFEQVLVNLLNNAAKYTEHGGHIRLAAARVDGEVVIRVTDDGIGISQELLPRIFDLFVQGERSLDRSQGGLGIGLTLVKRLVEMHGGSVAVHSDGPRKGSEFVVRLPAATAGAPDEAALRGGCDALAAAAPRGQRVLVVEDNMDAGRMLCELLGEWGHEVRHASDGEEALELAATFQPAIAIVDIGLPKMDGFEVARRLRGGVPSGAAATSPSICLIGLTGYGQEHNRRRAAEVGFDHYLVKPPDPVVLQTLLRGVSASAR